jgi:hypothetical protein
MLRELALIWAQLGIAESGVKAILTCGCVAEVGQKYCDGHKVGWADPAAQKVPTSTGNGGGFRKFWGKDGVCGTACGGGVLGRV